MTNEDWQQMVFKAQAYGMTLSDAEAIKCNPCSFCGAQRGKHCIRMVELPLGAPLPGDKSHEIRRIDELKAAMLMAREP